MKFVKILWIISLGIYVHVMSMIIGIFDWLDYGQYFWWMVMLLRVGNPFYSTKCMIREEYAMALLDRTPILVTEMSYDPLMEHS